MRPIFTLILAGGFTFIAGCGKKDDPASGGTGGPPPTGMPGIDGTYLTTQVNLGPIKSTPEELAKEPESERTVTIKGDKLTLTLFKQETWTIKVRSDKTPNEIDALTPAKKDSKGKDGKEEELLGIYKLDGDTLTLHFQFEGKGNTKKGIRPKNFTATDDSLLLVMKKK